MELHIHFDITWSRRTSACNTTDFAHTRKHPRTKIRWWTYPLRAIDRVHRADYEAGRWNPIPYFKLKYLVMNIAQCTTLDIDSTGWNRRSELQYSWLEICGLNSPCSSARSLRDYTARGPRLASKSTAYYPEKSIAEFCEINTNKLQTSLFFFRFCRIFSPSFFPKSNRDIAQWYGSSLRYRSPLILRNKRIIPVSSSFHL